MLEEYNTLLEVTMKRQMYWQIKDRATKSILTYAGTATFTHTRLKTRQQVKQHTCFTGLWDGKPMPV